MTNAFLLVELDRREDRVEARIHVPVDSPFFEGHFPGDPILPGVAQVSLVIRVLEEHIGRIVRVQEVRRTKFTSPVRPGMDLTIRLVLDGRRVSWRLGGPQGEVSSGDLLIGEDS